MIIVGIRSLLDHRDNQRPRDAFQSDAAVDANDAAFGTGLIIDFHARPGVGVDIVAHMRWRTLPRVIVLAAAVGSAGL